VLFNYIKEDIRRHSSNRVKKPISPDEKLSLTLKVSKMMILDIFSKLDFKKEGMY